MSHEAHRKGKENKSAVAFPHNKVKVRLQERKGHFIAKLYTCIVYSVPIPIYLVQ